jgi:nucleoside-diphosphate-sugar epimerase
MSQLPKVLVTGSRGFTGSHLCPLLRQRGYAVVGLVNGAASNPDEVACDITDPDTVARTMAAVRPDYLVHLAAISFVAHAHHEAMYRVNLFGTLNLLQGLKSAGIMPRKVLIASSANVYGNPPVERIDEALCPAPVNHYANSKLAMEHMVGTWFDQLPIIVTRPFNYTGPGQDERFLIPKIVAHFRAGKPRIELGNLDVVRDFSDVRDVAEAYARLLAVERQSETVNVCSGEGTALSDVLDIMNRLAGYRIETVVNPDFVRQNEIKRLVGDNRKLKSFIDFVPTLPVSETLKSMFTAVSR